MKKLLLILLALCVPATALAAAPRTYTHRDQVLTLRSIGLKEATIFKIDVYTVELYVPDPDAPPPVVLDPATPKVFRLTFLLKVDRQKLADSWLNDLKKHCPSHCDALLAAGRILAARLPDVADGDIVTYACDPEGVEILINEESIGSLPGPAAVGALTSVFLGPKSDGKLRRKLLGESFEKP